MELSSSGRARSPEWNATAILIKKRGPSPRTKNKMPKITEIINLRREIQIHLACQIVMT